MSIYEKWNLYFGDLHNHCGISYGHGSLEEALSNAREQLDFCSVTGHAQWPDMPEENERIADIVEFHNTGFERLRKGWAEVKRTMEGANVEGSFLTFPGYEIHSNQHGDYTIVNRDFQGEIVYASGIGQLKQHLGTLKQQGRDFLVIPHHIGYLQGFRGLNWETFTSEFSPLVEIFSMHGCSEDGETARPFLHTMGPADWRGTMRYGLERSNVFGVIGSTDHHSAHPGSHGHGKAAVWAPSLTREALWEALCERRTYAVTGDRIAVEFSVNGQPMGARFPFAEKRLIEAGVTAGGAIDYIDVVSEGGVVYRTSAVDFRPDRDDPAEPLHTKVAVEVGWGRKGQRFDWEVSLGVDRGEILSVEPRFRGREVLSPQDAEDSGTSYYESHWERTGTDTVSFRTATYGNPNTRTSGTQGLCLEVSIPPDAHIVLAANGITRRIRAERLVQGPKVGYVFHEPSSPAWRIERLPLTYEFDRRFEYEDRVRDPGKRSYYYLRVRQKNGQWAWSSPVFLSKE